MTKMEDQNKELIHRHYAACSRVDKEAALDTLADEVEVDGEPRDAEAWMDDWFSEFPEIFPDWEETVEFTFAKDDWVGVRWRFTGTHTGAKYMGIPPTGKGVEGTVNSFLRVKDGEIVEIWSEGGTKYLLEDLDLLPESQEEIKIRSQLLEVLLRVLRHNISNDLNAITGMADLIAAGDVPAEEYAERILQQAQNLQSTAQKVRDVEQAVVHERPPDTVNLAMVIGTVVAEQRQQYPEAQFEVSMAAGDLSFTSNQDTLSMVLDETIENAVIHNDSSEPEIEVDLSEADGDDYKATIVIADNGPGIPDHEREPIERGGEDPLEHGSGIGLWAIKWGVEQLDGEVEFEENEPTGSVVKLHLGDMD